jgi:hypothetical protein
MAVATHPKEVERMIAQKVFRGLTYFLWVMNQRRGFLFNNSFSRMPIAISQLPVGASNG